MILDGWGRTVFRDLVELEKYNIRSCWSFPRGRASRIWIRGRLKVLLGRRVSWNSDKAFRNLIDDFWTLVVIEDGVEDGLYPRKKRIAVGHVLRNLASRRSVTIPAMGSAHLGPRRDLPVHKRRCRPRCLSARSLFPSLSFLWPQCCSADSRSGGRSSR